MSPACTPLLAADPTFQEIFVGGGVLIALCILAALPLGLLIAARMPRFVARCTAAADRGRTKAIVTGAVVAVIWIAAWHAAFQRRDGIAPGLLIVMTGLAAAAPGLAADAARTGARLGLGTGPRAMSIGWLVRFGGAAAPIVWPVVLAYLAASAFGASALGLTAGKSTTEPSAGSTPEN